MPEKKINLEKIVNDYGYYNMTTIKKYYPEGAVMIISVMKEAIKQALELASDNIDNDKCFAYSSERNYYDEIAESIINTINQVE